MKATEIDRNYCPSNYEARLVLVLVFAVLLPVLVKIVVVAMARVKINKYDFNRIELSKEIFNSCTYA